MAAPTDRMTEFQRFTAPDPAALEVSIRETRQRLDQALARGDGRDIVEQAGDLAAMLTTARQEAAALELLQQHRHHAESRPDDEPTGWYWNAWATALQYTGRRAEADAVFAQALALCQAGGWRRLQSFVLQHWGRSLVEQDRLQEAEARFAEALALREALGDPRVESTRRALAALAAWRA